MLKVEKLEARIGENQVLRSVSLDVEKGGSVAVLGANGAGKTSLIRSIVGLLPATSGQVFLEGKSITGLAPHEIARLGVACVPEGRHVFADMSVQDNLTMGAYLPKARKRMAKSMDEVLELFPVLAKRRDQRAGTLSGGEQQMLAIGRALMSGPRLLILDELSLGLAPLVVQEIYRVLKKVGQNTTLLLVEQSVEQALKNSAYAYILETGTVVRQGASSELATDSEIKKAYLGI
jgi:branched-chain amino acid transport system ATP-binding protein